MSKIFFKSLSIFNIIFSKINSGDAPFLADPIFLIVINGIFLFKKSFLTELTLAFISRFMIFNSLMKKVFVLPLVKVSLVSVLLLIFLLSLVRLLSPD